MSRPMESFHGFTKLVKPISPMFGHMSFQTAAVLHVYPFGPRLRCPLAVWVEVNESRIVSGSMRYCTCTPEKEYAEAYTKYIAENGTNSAIDYYGEHKPNGWNLARKSRYALFMMQYLGMYKEVPENGNKAGKVSILTFQFHYSSSVTLALDMLEFCCAPRKNGDDDITPFFGMTELHAEVLNRVLKMASELRGGNLSRSFGVGEQGEQRYKRFVELVKFIPGYSKYGYV